MRRKRWCAAEPATSRRTSWAPLTFPGPLPFFFMSGCPYLSDPPPLVCWLTIQLKSRSSSVRGPYITAAANMMEPLEMGRTPSVRSRVVHHCHWPSHGDACVCVCVHVSQPQDVEQHRGFWRVPDATERPGGDARSPTVRLLQGSPGFYRQRRWANSE